VHDAQLIAGRYESSRRIETGFLSFFYMLSQTVISANADGTITMPSMFSGKPEIFRETAPGIWTSLKGDGRLALTVADGRKAVINSQDPTSVLQLVSPLRSAAWNLPVFLASAAIILLTLVAWPVGALVRRRYHSPLKLEGRDRWAYLLPRVAALIALGYLVGWFAMLNPILSNDLAVYNNGRDLQMRLLQLAGFVLILAAGAAVWSTWQTLRKPVGMAAKIGSVLVALAVLDVVWIGWAFKMISLNTDY
jgi:hypothetical protein